MAVLSIAALLVGVAGAVARPWRLPAWVVPVIAVVVVAAGGAVSGRTARHALDQLGDPLAFLLAAVPLAVLLDRLGFFTALAARITARSSSLGGLWLLAAGVTTVLNLDASVVLLTPLYVRIARQTGRDPLLVGAQPVLLACLASSALPVSNLTNLIAASATGAGTADFVTHLAAPSVVASAVGWWRYRALLAGSPRAAALIPAPGPAVEGRRALRIGTAVVAGVLVGFTAGRSIGLVPWEVAAAADAVLVVAALTSAWGSGSSKDVASRSVPWRAVPVGTALVAASLAVLAAAAVGHLSVDSLVGGRSVADLARTAGVAAVGANLINNLPALLVGLPAVGHGTSPALWALLLGVNMGPVLVVTGSLASLLWLDALRRLGVAVRARDFTRIGLRVGLPGALAGLSTALVLAAVGLVS